MTDVTTAKRIFVESIVPLFRSALIDKDSVLQTEGDHFTTVVNEAGTDTSFRFEYREHSIAGEVLEDGKVRVNPVPGQAETFHVDDLDRQKVQAIGSAWWQAVRAESIGS